MGEELLPHSFIHITLLHVRFTGAGTSTRFFIFKLSLKQRIYFEINGSKASNICQNLLLDNWHTSLLKWMNWTSIRRVTPAWNQCNRVENRACVFRASVKWQDITPRGLKWCNWRCWQPALMHKSVWWESYEYQGYALASLPYPHAAYFQEKPTV